MRNKLFTIGQVLFIKIKKPRHFKWHLLDVTEYYSLIIIIDYFLFNTLFDIRFIKDQHKCNMIAVCFYLSRVHIVFFQIYYIVFYFCRFCCFFLIGPLCPCLFHFLDLYIITNY